jgi:formylglycine-generating enzyme required for sulfatase activity
VTVSAIGRRLLPTKPERERGKTPEGVQDLAGNAQEWCRDWFGDYPGEDQTDPIGPATGLRRVQRGGHFADNSNGLRGAERTGGEPSRERSSVSRYDFADGFRVVWSAAGARQ